MSINVDKPLANMRVNNKDVFPLLKRLNGARRKKGCWGTFGRQYAAGSDSHERGARASAQEPNGL